MAKRRRRKGFGGLGSFGVLPIIGALTLGKVALIAGGVWAAKKLAKPKVEPAPDAPAPVTATSPGLKVGWQQFHTRPGIPSYSAARATLQTALTKPIASASGAAAAVQAADTTLAAATKQGFISPEAAQLIAVQPPELRVKEAASIIGVTPSVIAPTVLPTVQKTTVYSGPIVTPTLSTLLRL